MSSRIVYSRSAFVLALCISFLAYASPPIGPLEAQMLCAKRGVPSRPITTGMISEVAREFAHLATPLAGILVCEVGDDVPFYVESLSIVATIHHPAALVMWMRRSIASAIDRPTMRFVVTHEVGHTVLQVGDDGVCPEGDDIAAHIACEHQVDVYAMGAIGAEQALRGLEFAKMLLLASNRGALSVDIVETRIKLLRELPPPPLPKK